MATADELHAVRREGDFRPARFLMMIRRRFWLITGITVLLAAAAVAYVVTATKIWEATAVIRIDRAKTEATTADFAMETEVNTEMQVLGSRSLTEQVVDSLNLRVAIAEPAKAIRSQVLAAMQLDRAADTVSLLVTPRADSSFLISHAGAKDSIGVTRVGRAAKVGGLSFMLAAPALAMGPMEIDVNDRTQTIEAFQRRLVVDRPVRLGNLVSVAYRSTDPALAQQAMDLLVRRFLAARRNQGQGEAKASVVFLTAQLDSLQDQLHAAEDSLRRFRDQRHVVDLGVEAASGLNHLADLTAQRNTMAAERDALGRMLDEIRNSGDQAKAGAPSPYRRLIAFPTLLKNQAASQILNSLATLEDQRSQLLIRRTAADPDVQALTQRIADLDAQLASIAETYQSGLVGQIVSLDTTIRQMSQSLAEVPGKELESARLERRPNVLQEMYTQLQTRLKEAEMAQAAEDQSIYSVDAAAVPSKPSWPRPLLTLACALILGSTLGVCTAIAREYFDRSVHTRYDVQALTGVPVLGLIPRFPTSAKRLSKGKDGGRKNLVVGVNSEAGQDVGNLDGRDPRKMLVAGRRRLHGIAEAFGHLQTNLSFLGAEGSPRVIMITSPLPGDGKTTSATNLALILSQRGQRVLLIDADLRRGVINRAFSTSRSPGLTEALTGREPVEKAIWTVKTGEGHKLYFIPTGELPAHPAGMLGSAAMRELLHQLGDRYDVILLDSAPVNAVSDAAVLATMCDGVLVVARAGSTPLDALSFGIEQLRHVRAPIIGAILNDIDLKRDTAYDRVYQYYGAPEYTGAKS